MKKTFKITIKNLYQTYLKDIIYFVVLFLFACFVYLFIKDDEGPTFDEQAEEEVKAANDFVEQISIKTVSSNRLNDMVVQNFLRELIGKDYTMLLTFFSQDILNELPSDMTEVEMMNYQIKIASDIKDEMELTSALVVQNDEVSEVENDYLIQLNLQSEDEAKTKEIKLKVLEGVIVTKMEELF